MNPIQFTLVLLVLGSSSIGARAGVHDYHCEVLFQIVIRDDGTPDLRDWKKNPHEAHQNRFSIDRRTGAKIGSLVGPFRDQAGTVLATGNSSSAFVATWQGPAAGGGVHFDILRVEEYQSALVKPFVAVSGGTIYTGQCH